MTEIRVCWQPMVVHAESLRDQVEACNSWRPLNNESLQEIKTLCVGARNTYGVVSHWLETRLAPIDQTIN